MKKRLTHKDLSPRSYFKDYQGNIYYKRESGVIRLETSLERPFITADELLAKQWLQRINKQKANEIINAWYSINDRHIESEWEHNGQKFRKLPLFKSQDEAIKKSPWHDRYDGIMVWYRGSVYYHSISYNGESVGNLRDLDGNHLKWCSITNCAPILCINTNRIV